MPNPVSEGLLSSAKPKKVDVYNLDTPYRLLNLDWPKIQQNLGCWRSLASRLPRPQRFVESFGGYGRQTKVANEVWPGIKHEVWEQDLQCFEKLETDLPAGVEAHYGTYVPPPGGYDRATTISMDYNLFSVKHWHTIVPFLKTGCGMVIATDFAAGKLPLTFRAYGLKEPSWEGYLERMNVLAEAEGFQVIDNQRTPRSISYIALAAKEVS